MLPSFRIGEAEERFNWSVGIGFGILTVESCGEVVLKGCLATSLLSESIRHRDP